MKVNSVASVEKKHTISVLVENEFGVLARVSGLFSGRGYNIQSLSVAETLDPHISRMTLVTSGSDAVIEQIIKQLNKLVNVLKVQELTRESPINRILALFKLRTDPTADASLKKVVLALRGEVLDRDGKCCVLEFRGDETHIRDVITQLTPFGILEFVQTGNIAIQRGGHMIAPLK